MLKTSAILLGFAVACLVIGILSKASVVAATAAQEKPAKSDAATAKTVHAEMRNVECDGDIGSAATLIGISPARRLDEKLAHSTSCNSLEMQAGRSGKARRL
ncbi:MAG: hypothetical protein WBQ04_21555 [Candidatus Acidiferrales bacterium]